MKTNKKPTQNVKKSHNRKEKVKNDPFCRLMLDITEQLGECAKNVGLDDLEQKYRLALNMWCKWYNEYCASLEKIHELEQELKIRVEDNEKLYGQVCDMSKKCDELLKRVDDYAKQFPYNCFSARHERKMLKEQIKDANKILREMDWADRGNVSEYFAKWGG